jgi:Mg2+-importing ATPase
MKGEPEEVLARCVPADASATKTMHALYADGARVIAVAHRRVAAKTTALGDLEDLEFDGFLVFSDRPKTEAAESLGRLGRLGITVKVITGDSAESRRRCAAISVWL